MKILQSVKKVPGGLMIIPLLLGVLVNTVAPSFLQIGSFSTHLWKTGAMLPSLFSFFATEPRLISNRQDSLL